ncbi:MAG: hypothetical protein ACRDTZ_00360 [Pseudonocardiaceae bacterium]
MSDDTLRFILQVVAIFLGSGTVQLVIAVLRRKPELRKINTSADVDEATVREMQTTAQDKLITALQRDGEVYRDQVREFATKVTRLEDRAIQAQREFAGELRTAHAENTRLTTRVAQLQTDNDILQRQIDELRRRI